MHDLHSLLTDFEYYTEKKSGVNWSVLLFEHGYLLSIILFSSLVETLVGPTIHFHLAFDVCQAILIDDGQNIDNFLLSWDGSW